MVRTLALSFLALTIAVASCRGYSGDDGPAGQNGVDGTDGIDGKDGIDGTTGFTFDYVRGIHMVKIHDGVLVIKAKHVVPKSILDLAPDANAPANKIVKDKVSVWDGVQLVVGMPGANIRYHLVPVPKGEVKVTAYYPPDPPENWAFPFEEIEYLAMVPLDSVTALTLDPAVLAKGALIRFPENQDRTLKLYGDSICIGTEVWVRW